MSFVMPSDLVPASLLLSPRVLIGTIPSLFVAWVLWKVHVHSRRDRGTVPRAPHTIPWIGNLSALLLDPVGWPWKLHEQYGEVFTTTVLGHNVTFLRGQPMITAFAKGSTRELQFIEGYKRIITPLVGLELFSSNANEVREALTSQRLNENQSALYLDSRSALRNYLKDKVPEDGWSGPIVLQDLLSFAIFRQACFSLVSPTLAAVHSDYLYTRMRSMEINRDIARVLIPWETKTNKKRKQDRDEILDCVASYAKARMVELITIGEDLVPDDFLGYMIKTTWSRTELEKADEDTIHHYSEQVARRIYGLFFVGSLSTSTRGAWTIVDLLAEDPRHFQHIRTDIDCMMEEARNVSPDEPPRVEDHDFLNACITESVRQHPVGAWLRWAENPFVLPPGPNGEERVIPSGFVAVTTESIRNDPRVYYDEAKYDPERYFRAPFISKDEYKPNMSDTIRLDSVRAPPLNMNTTMQPTFGVGAHQCAGRFFAYRMIGTFITTLMESFDIELYDTPDNAGVKYKTVITPLFGSRELGANIIIRLKRREVPF